MIKPNTLKEDIVNLLLARLAALNNPIPFYRSASNWCKGVGLFKAAEYFANESEDELKHAKGIEDYLVDWNITVTLPTIKEPVTTFINVVDVIEQAYALEFNLYKAYNDISGKILIKGDYAAFDFVGKYREIQTTSVAEYSDKLNLLDGVEINKLKILLIEEKIF